MSLTQAEFCDILIIGVIYMDRVIEFLRNIKSAAILPHVEADADALGSCLAMREVLRGMGKKAEIYAETEPGEHLDFINDDIKVYAGGKTECDTCIALDCGDEERMGKRKALAEAAEFVINIDHHRTNTFFGDAAYVDPDASATGEVLAHIFKKMGIKLNRVTAKYLYTAICADTGGFAYSNVSPETFRIAAELIEYDIDHAEISRQLFNCVDLKLELLKAELTSRIHSYYGGKLKIVTVDEEIAGKYGVAPKEINDIVDLPRRIRGTEIAASVKRMDGVIRASLRSNGETDVSELALKFGGGGHIKAAGCTVEAQTLAEAEKLIVEAVGEMLQ